MASGKADVPVNRFRMPAEWEPQEAVWLSWPARVEIWEDALPTIREHFSNIAAVISRFQPVRINAAKDQHGLVWQALAPFLPDNHHIQLYDHPNDDIWCRDHGPIFVVDKDTEKLAAVNWDFNGWGEAFDMYEMDNEIPKLVAASLGIPCLEGGMVLEGGAIEVNSRGQLLTTEAVMLNPNRNPDLNEKQIEKRLKQMLGMNEIFWLGDGIEGDDTGGHVDDIARFIDDSTIIISIENRPDNPNYKPLQANRERLQGFRTPEGGRAEILEIPLPDPCLALNWRLPILPASYVNFLILNDAVLLPTFNQPINDGLALARFREFFPTREILPIPAIELVKTGGALHCISQQQPALS